MAQQVFDIMPRAYADLFQPLGAVANDNLLLRLSFDEDRAVIRVKPPLSSQRSVTTA